MAKRNLTINFFRIGIDGESRDSSRIHDVLVSLASEGPSSRVAGIGFDRLMLGEYQQVQRASHERAIWQGQLRRLRPNDRVAEGDEKGFLNDVSLEEGRSITELGHFLVVPDYRTILWQGSVQHVGWTMLRNYIQHFVEEDERIVMLPILRQDQAEQYARLNKPKKAILQIAKPDKWSEVDDPSLRRTTESVSHFGADYVTIEIGTQRGRTHLLDVANVKQLFQAVREGMSANKELQGRAEKLYIEGYTAEDGGEKVAIDFVEQRLLSRQSIEMRDISTINDWTHHCHSLLVSAFDRHVADIKATFIAANE